MCITACGPSSRPTMIPMGLCPTDGTASCSRPPTRPPTAAELENTIPVQQAMKQAWKDSQVDDQIARHEEGGWIYMDKNTGQITTRRAPPGKRAEMELGNPPEVPGSVVVGMFHTHPSPESDGFEPEKPSTADTNSANRVGVPSLIQGYEGVHETGPDSRRGGLGGGPGYPP